VLAILLDKLLELWEWVGEVMEEVKEEVHMELGKVEVAMEVVHPQSHLKEGINLKEDTSLKEDISLKVDISLKEGINPLRTQEITLRLNNQQVLLHMVVY